jgi:F-box/WD-40 domain protein 7
MKINPEDEVEGNQIRQEDQIQEVQEEDLSSQASFVRDSPESIESDDDFQSLSESLGNINQESNSKSTEENEYPLTDPPGMDAWLQTFQSWTNYERMTALESLVTKDCDIQQIRFLLSLIEPQLQRDFISLLPKELALYVLSFLDPKDLVRAAQTCQTWRILCEDNLLWREKCREEGLLDDNETIVDLFKKRSSKHHRSVAKSMNSHSGPSCSSSSSRNSGQVPFITSEYKSGFLRQKSIEYNWRFGRFPSDPDNEISSPAVSSGKKKYLKQILQLKGHDDHVITCLQFNPASK